MASNYDDVLRQLQTFGLLVDSLRIGEARPVRCKVEGDREKRGWYSLHELPTRSGGVIIVGSYGIWRGDDNNAQKVAIEKRDELTKEQLDSLRRRMAEDRKRADRERQAFAEKAAVAAAKAWAVYTPTGESAYLDAKGVQAHGVRFSKAGALVVPMLDTGGKIHGLQIIRDPATARAQKKLGKEFWPAGLAKTGHFHLIGMPQQLVLVAEGYATAATLHEATQLPVAVAFDAGNIAPVVRALRKRYKRTKILVCADDDALHACLACQAPVDLDEAPTTCPACGEAHGRSNAGVTAATNVALEIGDVAWVTPRFADAEARREAFAKRKQKLTDFNDLHALDGLAAVSRQIERKIEATGWGRALLARADTTPTVGGGDTKPLRPIQTLDELLERFALVYGQGSTTFDRQEHRLVTLSDMRDACTSKEIHRDWQASLKRQLVRVTQVVFEPAADPKDPALCNLWAGWPTRPKAGRCDKLLDLLRHMCSAEGRMSEELYQWVLRWLAYPLQQPGAKLKTTVVVHSKQGTGKNMFFEAVMDIYGQYGRVIDQAAVEDRFNDWASRKLFVIADEVLARSEIWHVKNKLKSLITGEWIRINPKNMAAYDERNHVNMVFLSNESMPVAIEEDDRRHAVIWTPDKLPREFYAEVKAELDAGGSAALHDRLLHLDLGDFGPATLPPMTDAKRELIHLGMDTTSQFYHALMSGEVGDPALPAGPVLSEDLYEAYRLWCVRVGDKRVAPMAKLVNSLKRRHGVRAERKRYLVGQTTKGPHTVLMIGDLEPDPGQVEAHWLGAWIAKFRDDLEAYKGSVR